MCVVVAFDFLSFFAHPPPLLSQLSLSFRTGASMRTVAALFVTRDKNVFVAKRWEDRAFGGLWEFPGKNPKGNETDEEALMRELEEDGFLLPRILGRVFFEDVSGDTISLFHVDLSLSGQKPAINPDEHSEGHWIDLDEMGPLWDVEYEKRILTYDWVPHDSIKLRIAAFNYVFDLPEDTENNELGYFVRRDSENNDLDEFMSPNLDYV